MHSGSESDLQAGIGSEKSALEEIRDQVVALQSGLKETQAGLARDLETVEMVAGSFDEISEGLDAEAAHRVHLRVNYLIRKLIEGSGQEELLEVYLAEVQENLQRGILFRKEEDSYAPWKGFGFSPGLIQEIGSQFPDSAIGRAGAEGCIIYLEQDLTTEFPWLLQDVVPSHAAVCIPFVFEDEVPLVFYGDAERSFSVDLLELSTHIVTLVLKNDYLQELLRSSDAVDTETAEPVPDLEPDAEKELGQTVSQDEDHDVQAEREPAVETSSVLSPEEEERHHNDARRLARLLVSEIQLYHEQEAEAGYASADLYAQLKEQIDRCREMYEKRAHPLVVTQCDYFHEEVVRVLAGGEQDLMGSSYPGPVLREHRSAD